MCNMQIKVSDICIPARNYYDWLFLGGLLLLEFYFSSSTSLFFQYGASAVCNYENFSRSYVYNNLGGICV